MVEHALKLNCHMYIEIIMSDMPRLNGIQMIRLIKELKKDSKYISY